MNIPYVNLNAQHAPIREELLTAISGILDRGQFILDSHVAEFEHHFAELIGVKYAIGVNSGTDALILAMKGLGIGDGDEVITAPNSFVASASSIHLAGARPVFVDVGTDYNIEPALIESAITPRTRAIMPVHLTGRPAEMDEINKIAETHGLYVIEDAAQAICAEYNGQPVGSISTAGCFSLHPLKTLNACGDGGVITTNDEGLYEQIRLLQNHGLKSRDACVRWGYNSRLDTIQAAILMVKLKHLTEWTEKRRSNADFYRSLIANVENVETPQDKMHQRAVYHTFVIQSERRDELKSYLESRGIGTAIHYPTPIHLHQAAAYLGYSQGSFPVTEEQAQKILSLPIYPELTTPEMEFVAECINQFFDNR